MLKNNLIFQGLIFAGLALAISACSTTKPVQISTIDTNKVALPPLPEKPTFAPVNWIIVIQKDGTVLYSLKEQDFKNLVANNEALKKWIEESNVTIMTFEKETQ